MTWSICFSFWSTVDLTVSIITILENYKNSKPRDVVDTGLFSIHMKSEMAATLPLSFFKIKSLKFSLS